MAATKYVDWQNGSDIANGDTVGTAYKTIAKALSMMTNSGVNNIYIRPGRYTEYNLAPAYAGSVSGGAFTNTILGDFAGNIWPADKGQYVFIDGSNNGIWRAANNAVLLGTNWRNWNIKGLFCCGCYFGFYNDFVNGYGVGAFEDCIFWGDAYGLLWNRAYQANGDPSFSLKRVIGICTYSTYGIALAVTPYSTNVGIDIQDSYGATFYGVNGVYLSCSYMTIDGLTGITWRNDSTGAYGISFGTTKCIGTRILAHGGYGGGTGSFTAGSSFSNCYYVGAGGQPGGASGWTDGARVQFLSPVQYLNDFGTVINNGGTGTARVGLFSNPRGNGAAWEAGAQEYWGQPMAPNQNPLYLVGSGAFVGGIKRHPGMAGGMRG